MKREDTYTIYRSEARGEAVRDARNTSEGKKSFIRMKQKFLPKETAVSSEGNFAHLSGSYRPACKLFALIAALLLLGANWNGVWGQQDPGNPSKETVMQILRGIDGAKGLVELIENNTINYDSYSDEKDAYEESSRTWVIDRVWSLDERDGSFWPDNVNTGVEVQSNISIQNQNLQIEGNARKIIYAKPEEMKELAIQAGDGADNLDGFLHWYVTTDLESGNKTRENLDWSGQDNSIGKALKFVNGLAWLRGSDQGRSYKLCLRYHYPSRWQREYWEADLQWTGWQVGDETSPSAVSKVHYTVPSTAKEGDVIYVVCEASARNNATGSGNTVVAPKISLKSVFEIHVLGSNDDRFGGTAKNPFTQSGSDGTRNLSSDAIAHPENYFLEHFEIHTPVRTGTNYRLSEPLGNYYVPNQKEYCWVQWRMFDSEGKPVEGTYNDQKTSVVTEQDKNILKYTFPYDNADKQYIYYITASVGYSSKNNWTGNVPEPDTWYPVSFMKVYLEPFTRPLTAQQLKDYEVAKNEDYQFRYDSYLKANGYEEVYAIPFENEIERISSGSVNKDNNTRTKIIENMRSSYAFVDLGVVGEDDGFQYRRNDRLSAGRGEFGLYRTLNYPDISKGSFAINDEKIGVYNDWFASHGYDVEVVDRTWEKTEGQQSGYFMYLDATDEPGIITKINITNLCPHTTLLVSAWICDLAESTSVEHADVDFTLKRIIGEGDNETEETLVKFYSGIVTNQPTHTEIKNINNPRAEWQQVAFQFTFDEGTYDDRYVLEIANNTPRSVGADYAIDDIMVYKSTPNISVQRENACESSTLRVSSDYETLRRNMSWDLNPDVLADANLTNVNARKFRYGLMGPDPSIWADGSVDENNELSRYLGNVYFGFVEDPTVTGSNPNDWVTVNKRAMEHTGVDKDKYALYKSIRVAVPTNGINSSTSGQNDYVTTDPQEALRREYILNVRAMNDFVADVKNTAYNYWNNKTEASGVANELEEALNTLWFNGDANADAIVANNNGELDLYESSVIKLFNFLGIPRVRCPWRSTNGAILYLNAIEVGNTDLRFAGEKTYDDAGNTTTAKGIYWVVLFSATDVFNAEQNPEAPVVIVSDDCTLKSEFYVVPSITITVDTETQTGGVTCIGSIHTLNADLMVADVDDLGNIVSAEMKPFEEKYTNASYTFDWFLGSEAEYNQRIVNGRDLQAIIKDLRDELNSTTSFDVDDVENSDLAEEEKDLLIALLGDENSEPLLVTGKNISFRWTEKVVAIPYVPTIKDDELIKLFCTHIEELTLEAESNVPELSFGFSGVDYPDDKTSEDIKLFNAPLRLGLRHLKNGIQLQNIPIREDIDFGVGGSGHSLRKLPTTGRTSLLLRNSPSVYTEVATLDNLYVDMDDTNNTTNPNTLSFTFKNPSEDLELADLFKEGEIYSLYVPFGEYDENGDFIPNSCEGYAVLEIKVVPEYLTWSGKGSTWYNDEGAWTMSTSEELYEKVTNTVSTPSFSPLYFTKITVPGFDEDATTTQNELSLKDESSYEKQTLNFVKDVSGATTNIQYDMAVGSDDGSDIRPYYGNWVEQIYFKPEASIYRQDYLDYEKAWVDFEMEAGKPYWMSAPLQNVYAGDMYAPSDNGRQETAAFTDITYKGKHEKATTNSRWSPAFYQKAWDKAIAYVTKEGQDAHDAANATDVAAVKSNWSIEYNDVWVPYSEGKGFYARVENLPDANTSCSALVRLPKADTKYSYEASTRAANNLSDGENINRTNAYSLMDKADNGTTGTDITLDLSSDADADGDGEHFLIGNPYMGYLKMTGYGGFLTVNSAVLANKFWTLDRTTGSIVVGTPDVTDWDNAYGAHIITDASGGYYVAPMTAFFVELKNNLTEDASKEITFSTSMIAQKPTTTDNVYTKSYSATNPTLTITAERGETKSVAKLVTSDKADNGYEASEDAVVLLDSELDAPMVYTVAGDVAAQFNTMQSIKNVPLGVYADKGEEVELTIRGISQFAEKLYLYDAVTKQSTPLDDDSYTFRVTGPSHGRFTLTSQNRISAESDICVYSPIPGQLLVMSSPEEPLQRVQVYDMSGRMVTSRDNIGNTTSQLTVPSGIYVVYAENETGNVRVKVRVR